MTEQENKIQQPAGAQPAGAQPAAPQQQTRPCPKDCRKCPMAQQICCASMLSFQMYDVMNTVIRRIDAQAVRMEELSRRLDAIQSSEGELSSPTPMDLEGFKV